jgi:multicomponent Na+:H+ antiporter subunit F
VTLGTLTLDPLALDPLTLDPLTLDPLAVDPLALGAVLFVALGIGILGRAVAGPTVQDRVIAVNALGTITVVVIVLVGAAFDEPGFLDVALVYALLNFLLSIGLGKVLIERGEVL